MQKTKREKTTENLIKAELIKHSKKLCYCNKMVSRCCSRRRRRSRRRNREGNRIKQTMAEGAGKTLPNKLPGNPNSPRVRGRREGQGRVVRAVRPGCKLVFIDSEFIMQSRSGKRSKRGDSR